VKPGEYLIPLTISIHLHLWKNINDEVQVFMKQEKKDRLGLSGGNYILLVAALVILSVGYIVMGQNEIVISPVLLVIAYIIVIPVALLIRFKKKD
jgi:hypothetical protein